MIRHALLAAGAATALCAVPASAATVTFPATSPSPGGVITLNPAGTDVVSGFLGFDVSGTGDFVATLTFLNPFANATAGGSAVFNFDGDVITFTGGDISGAGTVTTALTFRPPRPFPSRAPGRCSFSASGPSAPRFAAAPVRSASARRSCTSPDQQGQPYYEKGALGAPFFWLLVHMKQIAAAPQRRLTTLSRTSRRRLPS